MNIKIVPESSNTPSIEPTEIKNPDTISAPVLPELLNKAVEQVMGIESEEEKRRYRDDLDILLQYAKSQTKDHSPENIKWIIRSIELKLGTPPLAEKRIKYMARYAYLSLENNKIKEEMKKFEQI